MTYHAPNLQEEYEFRGVRVRSDVLRAINMHVTEGHPSGHFVTAVLENDLFEACARADPDSAAQLSAIVGYIYNCVPPRAYGSREQITSWASKVQAGIDPLKHP